VNEDAKRFVAAYLCFNLTALTIAFATKLHYYGTVPAVTVGLTLFSVLVLITLYFGSIESAKPKNLGIHLHVVCYVVILQMCLIHGQDHTNTTIIHVTTYHGDGVYTIPLGVYTIRVTACGSGGGPPNIGYNNPSGSRGALIVSDLYTLPNTQQFIEIGDSMGSPGGSGGMGNGNGGSFTGLFSDVNKTVPLVIAAGGGGTGYTSDGTRVHYFKGGDGGILGSDAYYCERRINGQRG
jgi:hypothetical protein